MQHSSVLLRASSMRASEKSPFVLSYVHAHTSALMRQRPYTSANTSTNTCTSTSTSAESNALRIVVIRELPLFAQLRVEIKDRAWVNTKLASLG